jgi:predicted ABC-type ATPase
MPIKTKPPYVIILAGPNGAGKSTTAPMLLRDTLAVQEFVNADAIARGLSAFAPDKVSLQAGRIMLKRLKELSTKRVSFAFETTLASRIFAPWLTTVQSAGYRSHLVFLALPSPLFAAERVAARVRLGGHDIPGEVITRRYHTGLYNLFQLYIPIVSSWKIYDNSLSDFPAAIAESVGDGKINIINTEIYQLLKELYGHGR